MSASSYKYIKPGDLVWIMVPGINSGLLGIAVKKSFQSNKNGNNSWSVLVGGKVNHYVDYLLSPLDDTED